MKQDGVTVMIGLLGPNKKMGKESESLLEDDMSECPLATSDEIVNRGNKQKAILTAAYGPAEVEGENCGMCEYGEKLKGCGLKKGEVYCSAFDFKCAEKNVCSAFEAAEEEED